MKLEEIVDQMEPAEAMTALAAVVRRLFAYADESARMEFLYSLLGDADENAASGLVYRWLATCMDEGVDPKKMCRGLFDKVARSEQLASVADPEILVLFEDWLEEIEMEVIRLVKTSASDTPESIAERAGLSRAGALFILSKLKKEGKIPWEGLPWCQPCRTSPWLKS